MKVLEALEKMVFHLGGIHSELAESNEYLFKLTNHCCDEDELEDDDDSEDDACEPA